MAEGAGRGDPQREPQADVAPASPMPPWSLQDRRNCGSSGAARGHARTCRIDAEERAARRSGAPLRPPAAWPHAKNRAGAAVAATPAEPAAPVVAPLRRRHSAGRRFSAPAPPSCCACASRTSSGPVPPAARSPRPRRRSGVLRCVRAFRPSRFRRAASGTDHLRSTAAVSARGPRDAARPMPRPRAARRACTSGGAIRRPAPSAQPSAPQQPRRAAGRTRLAASRAGRAACRPSRRSAAARPGGPAVAD